MASLSCSQRGHLCMYRCAWEHTFDPGISLCQKAEVVGAASLSIFKVDLVSFLSNSSSSR